MGQKINDIKQSFQAADPSRLPELIREYATDERSGVKALVAAAEKKLEAFSKERQRIRQMKQYEEQYKEYAYICGVDEVGRGPLAGPVMAGAVILPKDCELLYVNDSKRLSEKKREELYDAIMEEAVATGIGCVSPGRIDAINILQATYEAMRMAINGLCVPADLLLVDAVTIPGISIRQIPIVKGDAKSLSIAAASIIAKVTRDRVMTEYDRIYPEYGFAGHKGYGSREHMEAIKKYGPTPIHRRSFLTKLSGDGCDMDRL